MPAPIDLFDHASKGGQKQNHSIQKSQSVGGFSISKLGKKTPNQHSTLQSSNLRTVPESEESETVNGVDISQKGLQISPKAPNTAPLRRKKKGGLGYILNWLKGDQSKRHQAEEKIHPDGVENPKNSRKVLSIDLISNGTNINHGLVPSRSLDSLCSVASTSSFAYVPISSYSSNGTGNGKPVTSNKRISVGPNCSKETYKARMDFRRKRIVQDLNVSLTAKYKLQPADYSPPTLRKSENFSAISGPNLPSGPHLPLANGHQEVEDDCWSESSTLSFEENSQANYSAASPLQSTASAVAKPNKQVISLIKPKERKGQVLQALTLPSPVKNALEDIGHTSRVFEDPKPLSKPPGKNPFEEETEEEELNFNTLKHVPDNDKTLRRSPLSYDLDDTESTAPTMACGWDGDRLNEVRPYAHIPGKRKAPRAPNPQPQEELGAAALEIASSSEAKIHKGLNQHQIPQLHHHQQMQQQQFHQQHHQPQQQQNKQQLQQHHNKSIVSVHPIIPQTKETAEPVKLLAKQVEPEKPKESLKIESITDHDMPKEPSDCYADRFEPVEVHSPKPWYKKNPFNFDKKSDQDFIHLHASPSVAHKSVKQATKSKTVLHSSPQVRPISLLASISDFDRLAAEIVSQRQKEQKSLQRANDEAFYCSNNDQEENQVAIDAIMDEMEKKMDCLDAIEKHNQRWEDHLFKDDKIRLKPEEKKMTSKQNLESKEEEKRTNSPTTDMHNLVSDLNSFLNTTQKEIHTPKSTKKKMSINGVIPNSSHHETKPTNNINNNVNNNNKHVVAGHVALTVNKNEKWSCSKCTLINPGHIRICSICGASRQQDKPEIPEEPTIFDPPNVLEQDDQEEQMPQKGNVLDRVVQFTALQMFAREAPVNKPSLTPGVAKMSGATANENKSYLGALPKQGTSTKLYQEDLFDEPRSPTKLKDENGGKYFESESLRLEKEERAAILAQWKREHDERARARKDYFQMVAVRQREDVIQQQARLLEEANRKLDQNLNPREFDPVVRTKTAVLQPLNMVEKEPDFHRPVMAIHTTPTVQKEPVMTQQEVKRSFTSSNIPNGPPDRHEVKRAGAATNDFQNSGFRFDALKTPSYFLSKTSTLEKIDNFGNTSSEKTDSSPESLSDHENTDQEKLRQKRLAFFERNLMEPVKITSTPDSIKITPTAMLVREVESTKRDIPQAKIISKSNSTSNFNFDSTKSLKKFNDKRSDENHKINENQNFDVTKKFEENKKINEIPPIFNTQKWDLTDTTRLSKQADIINLTHNRKTGALEIDKSLKKSADMSHYDYPKFPARPVSPSFFKQHFQKNNAPQPAKKIDENHAQSNLKAFHFDSSETNLDSKQTGQDKTKNPAVEPSIISFKFTSEKAKEDTNNITKQKNQEEIKLNENHSTKKYMTLEPTKTHSQTTSNGIKDTPKSNTIKKERLPSVSSESSDEYEHIYCEIEPLSKRDTNPEPSNQISYTNCGNKNAPILDFKPLKMVQIQKPVRPTRNKILKKATSLDSEDLKINTPAMQRLDRATPAPQLFDRATPANRPTGPPPPRLRSASGDQGTNLERSRFGMTADNIKEKRRSYHQYPTETFQDSRLNQFIPPALPNNFSSPIMPKNLSPSTMPNNLTLPGLPNRVNTNSLHDRNELTTRNNSSEANQRKTSDPKKDISSLAIQRDNFQPNCNGVTERKFQDLKKTTTQDQFDSPRRNSSSTLNFKLANNENDKLHAVKSKETGKRLSGNFQDLIKPIQTSDMDVNKRLKETEHHLVRESANSKPKAVGHSKLTKTEERYIADLLNAKMCFPEKVKSKAPEKPVQDELEEERKKGAIRKRPPPLQEPASRPQSSFIMDDVLYTTRPLPDEDLGRYNPETFVAFHLIAPDDFEPNKVQKPVQKQTKTQSEIISKEDIEILKKKKAARLKTTACQTENLEPKEKPVESSSSKGPTSPSSKTSTPSFLNTNTAPLPTSPTSKTPQAIIPTPTSPRAPSLPSSPIEPAPLLPSGPKESVGVMDLLNKAIAEGKHAEAAQLAKEVSKSQISAKLVGSSTTGQRKLSKSEKISLNMYVEDKMSCNGPISVIVNPNISVSELKILVQNQFEFPANVQRWILDKTLADHDDASLASLGIDKSDQKIFLYLVAPESNDTVKSADAECSAQTPEVNVPCFNLPFGTTPLPPELQQKKGRYWNYEKNRWSFCSDDSDNEEKEKASKTRTKTDQKDIIAPDTKTKSEPKDMPLSELEAKTANKDIFIPMTKVNIESTLKADTTKEIEMTHLNLDVARYPQVQPALIMKPEEPVQILPKILPARIPQQVITAPGKTQQVDPRDGWVCPSCTLLNIPTRPGCEACTTTRPEDYVVPAPGPLDTLPRTTGPMPAPKLFEPPKPKEVKPDNMTSYKKLDDLDLIPSKEAFECVICFMDIEPGDGVVLRECLHTFCKECLTGVIEHSDSSTVGCPYKDEKYSCDMTVLEREIKALVSKEILEKHQAKSLKEAQANSKNSFICKTPDCKGWCFISDNINVFKCPICKRENCITCQAIHEGQDCKQYQLSLLEETQDDENSAKTKVWIEGLISSGDALKCPSCQVILLKKWGCDWVRCTYCKTEICWVTKQLRWGPKGKGDTNGGCRCMADGRTKCHSLCNYCH